MTLPLKRIALPVLVLCVLVLFFAVDFEWFATGARATKVGRPTEYVSTQANRDLLQGMHTALSAKFLSSKLRNSLKLQFDRSTFPHSSWAVAIVLYEPERGRIFVVRKGASAFEGFWSALKALKGKKRFSEFSMNPDAVRVQLDFILSRPQPINFEDLSVSALGDYRFETGVDGLRISKEGRAYYLLPGDAFVKSIHSDNQLVRYVKELTSSSELVGMNFERFRSESYVSFQNKWLRLFRGYPLVTSVTPQDLERVSQKSIRYLVDTQRADGQFVYFYDARWDSFKDRIFPVSPSGQGPYYNIVRHLLGAIILEDYLEQHKDAKALDALRAAIDYTCTFLSQYSTDSGDAAAFIDYNLSSKLGAQGVGLYTLIRYKMLTGDVTYDKQARLLKNHILEQIHPDGEFQYYRRFHGKDISEHDNSSHFSFYYPGEAMLGLVMYYRMVATPHERKTLLTEIQRTMKFLLEVRPDRYAARFRSLPSDSWLMMAVNEMWEIPELRQENYSRFVFENVRQMMRQLYTEKSALYHDYIGAFFYEYGEQPYPDGARGEGVLAALELAKKTKNTALAEEIFQALQHISYSTLHLVNTEESSYFALRPDRTVGGVRLKLTRQWFRVDTVAHVVAMYLRFLQHWKKGVYRPRFSPKNSQWSGG